MLAYEIRAVEQILGCTFHDKTLLQKAFRHRSLEKNPADANLLLAWLGDAHILRYVRHRLIEMFLDQYACLAFYQSYIVSNRVFADIIRHLGLGRYLCRDDELDEMDAALNDTALGTLFEALVEALSQDQGEVQATAFLDQHLGWRFPAIIKEAWGRNPIYRVDYLAPRTHGQGSHFRFRPVPRGGGKWEAEVWVGATLISTATGRSKKEAQFNAATVAVKHLEQTMGETG